MASVEFTIERQSFDPVVLDTQGGGPFGLQSNTLGLGVGPVAPRMREGAGDGSSYMGDRTGHKEVDLGIIVLGSGREDTEALIRRLTRLVRTRRDLPQPVLVATYATGEVLEMPFVYSGGLELDHLQALPEMYTTTLSIICPRPYWVARSAIQLAVQSPDAPVGLLPELARLQVGQSVAIGDVEVDNRGDVDAPLILRVTGPGGPTTFDVNGVGFVLTSVLAEGEVITVDTETKTVTDQTGANRYGSLGTAPRFPMLPPGTSDVHLQMDGASPGRWEPTAEVLYRNRISTPALRGPSTGWSSWSNGHATQSIKTTGFAGSADGYVELAWTADAEPHAAISRTFEAAAGERLSGAMDVLSTRAQIMQAAVVYFDALDQVVLSVYSDPSEVPANTVVRLGVSGSVSQELPSSVVRGILTVSTAIEASDRWQAGDTLRATRAAVTESDEILPYFDGASLNSGWTGAADASESVQFLLQRVAYSEIAMYYKPRREVVY